MFLLAICQGVSAQAGASADTIFEARAQAEGVSTTKGVTRWTRERLDAAKKRWAQNQTKFADCSRQLGETKKAKRLSLHDQGHFLDDCMRRAP
jgi:hypothetical protein